MSGNNEYVFASLLAKAKAADLWIDVADSGTMRGRGCGNTNNKERISRALSWYARSEETSDDDRLICAFISFNALYSQDGKVEKEVRKEFLEKIENGKYARPLLDFTAMEIKKIEDILSMQYISPTYWNSTAKYREKYKKMEEQKNRAKKITRKQIENGNFTPINKTIDRIYLLRNQVLHGMAAYKDSYNRKQINLCADFLYLLVGRIITAVILDSDKNWGKVSYPPQGCPNESRVEVEELE